MTDGMRSRKFWLALGLVALSSALLWYDKVGADVWKWVMGFSVAPYFLANVMEKFAGGGK